MMPGELRKLAELQEKLYEHFSMLLGKGLIAGGVPVDRVLNVRITPSQVNPDGELEYVVRAELEVMCSNTGNCCTLDFWMELGKFLALTRKPDEVQRLKQGEGFSFSRVDIVQAKKHSEDGKR